MSNTATADLRPDAKQFAPEALEVTKRLSGKVLVDGDVRKALTDETFDVIHPGDLSVIGQAPKCGADDVDAAVEAARKALGNWRKVPARDRGRMLQKAADAIEENAELVEQVLALDTGNALRTQARPETASSIDLTRMFGGLAGELKGETVPSANTDVLQYTTRDPIGVVAGIIPWNAPLFLFAAKVAPALAAGNTVVIKTAEQAPFCVLFLAEIMNHELPAGVLNVISGYGEECGKPLVEHPTVRKVTFTGSLPVGQAIAGYAAPKLCPVTLELGGKNPSIVMADADLELAVPGIIEGMRYTRQGQACTAGTRVFVHESVYDQVIEGVVAKLADIKLGNPLDEATDMGAIISEEQFNRTLHYMDIARNAPGARVLFGGERPTDPYLSQGYFYPPTLLDGLPIESEVCQDEIFGPVATVLPFKSFDEMITSANDTEYGLAANLWTRDLSRALEYVERIEAGFVQVNQCVAPRSNVSYGGLKMSGLGKEYALDSMVHHFTCSKTVLINRGTPGPEV
ncbi:MAG: aldehyde dehydrogenase family protein [Hyphomicrobiales bacterium]|nr:aldehyde dehydrogenase family protein [Hyphomicrobiales bacterium]